MNVLESIQPGICGDYGEAIMPVRGNWPGDYHTHLGYWCGGVDAIASFRAWLMEKFGLGRAIESRLALALRRYQQRNTLPGA